MAMTISVIISFIRVVFATLLLLSPPSHCLIHTHAPTLKGSVVVAEKTRLGSTPPSCHNKCNQCHPCMAVQVPTIPSHNRVRPSRDKPLDYFDSSSSPANNRYSNYKPLGWKCRCDGHFYNP